MLNRIATKDKEYGPEGEMTGDVYEKKDSYKVEVWRIPYLGKNYKKPYRLYKRYLSKDNYTEEEAIEKMKEKVEEKAEEHRKYGGD